MILYLKELHMIQHIIIWAIISFKTKTSILVWIVIWVVVTWVAGLRWVVGPLFQSMRPVHPACIKNHDTRLLTHGSQGSDDLNPRSPQQAVWNEPNRGPPSPNESGGVGDEWGQRWRERDGGAMAAMMKRLCATTQSKKQSCSSRWSTEEREMRWAMRGSGEAFPRPRFDPHPATLKPPSLPPSRLAPFSATADLGLSASNAQVLL